MTVGTFRQPNHETIGLAGSDYKDDIDNSIAAMARLAAAFAPHEQDTPDMTVRVDPGPVWVSGTLTEKAAQDSATITAPDTYPRIDRVVKDSLTGVISVIAGTQAASPAAPAITTGKEPICQVLLQTTTTAIDNTMITDERVIAGGSSESHKVGGIYLDTTGVNPATTLGYGTWVLNDVIVYPHSQYPPAQSDTYVKATSKTNTSYWPYYATDPTLPLTGAPNQPSSWQAIVITNQRFHIDLGAAIAITRLYYENYHATGGTTNAGAKEFTVWGSNDAAAFAELTYNTDTNWTQLPCDISQFLQHIAVDQADPHYVNITNSEAYRYYAIKIANNWGNATILGVRRFELQTRDIFDWKRSA
jgi:hypothetical protein